MPDKEMKTETRREELQRRRNALIAEYRLKDDEISAEYRVKRNAMIAEYRLKNAALLAATPAVAGKGHGDS